MVKPKIGFPQMRCIKILIGLLLAAESFLTVLKSCVKHNLMIGDWMDNIFNFYEMGQESCCPTCRKQARPLPFQKLISYKIMT
jgi:hypothetical protein